jgi:tryptophanyl-tRNA synthetase
MIRTLDTKCEVSDSEEQTVSEVAGIKEEQIEVDIKIEHAGDGEQNFEDFEAAENSDVDSVKEEFSDDDNYQENEVSDRKKSPQEFCGRCKKNIAKSLFTSHLESCHPNNEDFQVITSTLLNFFRGLSD